MAEAGPLSDLAAGPRRPGPGPARVRHQPGRGRAAAAAEGGQAARAASIPGLSRATYLDALSAAIFAGRLASPGGGVWRWPARPPRRRRRRRAAAGAGPAARRPGRALQRGVRGGRADAAPGAGRLRRRHAAPRRNCAGCGWPASPPRCGSGTTSAGTRCPPGTSSWPASTGALSELPLALTSRAYLLLFAGELTAAAALADEVQAVKEATGSGLAPYGALGLAALRGDEARAQALIDADHGGRDPARRGRRDHLRRVGERRAQQRPRPLRRGRWPRRGAPAPTTTTSAR